MGEQTIPLPSGGSLEYFDRGGAGNRKGVIRQRVTIPVDSHSVRLSEKLPAGARVTWSYMKNVTAVAVQFESGSTTAATGIGGYALAVNAATTITSLTTNATTDYLLRSQTTGATAGTFVIDSSNRGLEDNLAIQQNLRDPRATTDVGNTIFLLPAIFTSAAGAVAFINPDTTAATSGYNFSAAAEMDVEVWFDQFDEEPNNA